MEFCNEELELDQYLEDFVINAGVWGRSRPRVKVFIYFSPILSYTLYPSLLGMVEHCGVAGLEERVESLVIRMMRESFASATEARRRRST